MTEWEYRCDEGYSFVARSSKQNELFVTRRKGLAQFLRLRKYQSLSKYHHTKIPGRIGMQVRSGPP